MCFFFVFHTGNFLLSANKPTTHPAPSSHFCLERSSPYSEKIRNTLIGQQATSLWRFFREGPRRRVGKNRQPTNRLSAQIAKQTPPTQTACTTSTESCTFFGPIHAQVGVGGHTNRRGARESPQQFPRSIRQPIFQDVQGGVHHALHSPSKKIIEHPQSGLLCFGTDQGWGGEGRGGRARATKRERERASTTPRQQTIPSENNPIHK